MTVARPRAARLPRALSAALGVALTLGSLAGGVVTATSAHASPTLTVTSTTTERVPPSATTPLSGLSITGDPTDPLQATVSTDLGTLSIATTTNLTLAYNNAWTGTNSVTFQGAQSDIDNALASVSIVTGATTGTAHVGLTAMVAQSGYAYLSPNQHFYEYVPSTNISWTAADAAAKTMSFNGQQGYLATIPSSTVNTFVSNKIQGAQNVWFGARSYESGATDNTQQYATVNGTTYARVWRWAEGSDESPIAGGVISECPNQASTCQFVTRSSFYDSWANGEPNNYNVPNGAPAYSGEWAAVTNWSGGIGAWNDLAPGASGISGYVVEFGGKTNSDPSLGTGFSGVTTATSNVTVASAASVPTKPTITVARGDGQLTVTWNPPVDGGSAITGYDLSTDGGTTWTAITPTASTAVVSSNVVTTETQVVTGLVNGTSYGIRVRADNAVGNGTPSDVTTMTPYTVPSSPVVSAATAGNFSITVSWSAPATGGSPITGYTATAGGHSCTTTTATSCTITGLQDGTAYAVSVTATNAAGTGAAGTWGSSVTPVAPSLTPSSPPDTNQPQHATAPFPSGGSVTLLDAQGNPATTVTVAGEGTYTIDTATGVITFTPAVGFVGTPDPVTYRSSDGHGSTGTATFQPGAVTAPAAPSPAPLTPSSAPVTNQPQHATASIPSGGSVTLLDGQGNPVTTVTVGEGTYTIDTATGVITFTPAVGFVGTPTPVGYQVTDAYAQSGSSTFSPGAVTAPAAPPTSTVGPDSPADTNQPQSATIPVPSHDTITLLDADGNPTNTVTVAGEGTYTLDPTTGVITFTPVLGWTGLPDPVSYAITDAYGQSSTSTFAPDTVTAPASPTPPVLTPSAPATTNQPQQTTATIPTGGSITLIDGDGNASDTVTVPGQGTYALDPVTGVITFTPVTGFTGTPDPVTYDVTDAYGQLGASTFAPAPVTAPAGPSAAPTSGGDGTGVGGRPQPLPVTVPSGDTVTLLDGNGNPATTVSVGDEGTYTLDTTTGLVTFTPAPGWHGTPDPVTYEVTDPYGQSATAVVTAASVTIAPAAPTITEVAVGDGAVTVTITAPTDNGGSPVTGYTIVVGPDGRRIPVTGSGAVTVDGLTNGLAYTFTVVATNAVGTSAASAASTATPVASGAPGLRGLWTANHKLVVTVVPPASTGTPIVGYVVRLHPGSAVRRLPGAAGGQVVFTGLRNGVRYSATVQAEYAATGGPTGPTMAGVPMTVPSTPKTHVFLTANRMVVKLVPPTNNGGAKVTSYRVVVTGSGLRKAVSITVPAKKRVVTVYGLRPHTKYRIAVSAVNAAGRSKSRHGVVRTTAAPAAGLPLKAVLGHPVAVGTTVNLGGDATFAFDSATLLPSARSALARLARTARGFRVIACAGYADFGGATAHEYSLALARAQAVCDFLVAHGVARRGTTVSYGSTRPLVRTGDRSVNRRVTVTFG